MEQESGSHSLKSHNLVNLGLSLSFRFDGVYFEYCFDSVLSLQTIQADSLNTQMN